MDGKKIGIKLADGSLYPVLEQEASGQKRLVVTTVRDNQETVQIDLYRGEGERADTAEYIGTLIIENIQPAPKRDPEVEVILGVDPEGNLNASASDRQTGERQSLTVSLASLGGDNLYTTPDFELEEEEEGAEEPAVRPAVEQGAEEDELLTGETYPIGQGDRRREHLQRRRRSPLLLVVFILLSLIIIAAVAFLVLRALDGQSVPPLFGARPRSSAVQEPSEPPSAGQQLGEQAQAPADTGVQPETAGQDQGVAQESGQSVAPAGAAAVAPSAAEGSDQGTLAQKKTPEGGVWHRIKWGDTLWDIASSYYRNPWLYPRIARANNISNPDVIYAGRRLFIPED